MPTGRLAKELATAAARLEAFGPFVAVAFRLKLADHDTALIAPI